MITGLIHSKIKTISTEFQLTKIPYLDEIASTPKELPIIIKSDVHGSSEALKNAIEKIKHA